MAGDEDDYTREHDALSACFIRGDARVLVPPVAVPEASGRSRSGSILLTDCSPEAWDGAAQGDTWQLGGLELSRHEFVMPMPPGPLPQWNLSISVPESVETDPLYDRPGAWRGWRAELRWVWAVATWPMRKPRVEPATRWSFCGGVWLEEHVWSEVFGVDVGRGS